MRTLSRMTIAGAAALTLLLAPVGIATAQAVTSAPAHNQDAPSITLTTQQRAAVISARATYIKAATAIKKDYRKAVGGIIDGIQAATATAQENFQLAKDAYVITRATGGAADEVAAAKATLDSAQTALRTALTDAKAAAQPSLDKAKNDARTALDDAKAAYVKAITDAVPTAPTWLLSPPGGGKGWFGHGLDSGMSMGMGTRR